MDIKKTADDVVEHVKRNKWTYIVGLTFGTVIVILLVKNNQMVLNATGKAIAVGYKAVANNTETTKIIMETPGNSGNIVMDDLGNIFMSQNKAAEALGVTKQAVANHLKGEIPNLNGRILKKVIDGVTEYELVRH